MEEQPLISISRVLKKKMIFNLNSQIFLLNIYFSHPLNAIHKVLHLVFVGIGIQAMP